MFYLVLMLLVLVASTCLGLSKYVATRILGFMTAATTFIAALLLLFEWQQGSVLDVPSLTWLQSGTMVIAVAPTLGVLELVLALTLLYSGTLALLTLALTLAPTVRGFGTLFAWMLLALAVALLGLNSSRLLVPFIWALVVLLGYVAARSSGALSRSEALPQGVTVGLLASLLLLGCLLVIEPDLMTATMPPAVPVIGITLACVILVGGAPFHNAFDELVMAPAALGAFLYGCVLPVLAITTLLNVINALPFAFAPLWQSVLIGPGILSLIASVTGALREHRVRRLLGWQASAQASLALVSVGLAGPLAVLATLVLCINLAFTTITGGIAATLLERLTGSDDFTQTESAARLRWPGVFWGLAALSALGLPPWWGFWGRYWLIETAITQAAWVVPLIIATTILAALAYLGPLAKFWEGRQRSPEVVALDVAVPHPTTLLPGDMIVLCLALLPLLVLGVWPGLVWQPWLQGIPGGPAALPIGTTLLTLNLVVAVVVLLLLPLLLRRGSVRQTLSDEDMTPIMLAPDALAEGLSWLAWLARPEGLFRRVWRGMQRLSAGMAVVVAPFEQRFYMAAVLLAIISIIVLMAQ